MGGNVKQTQGEGNVDRGILVRERKKGSLWQGTLYIETRQRPTLPPRLQGSTIGAGGLNFRVRNGNGCDPPAIATWSLFLHTLSQLNSGQGGKRTP
jgi:hypothetical protein